LVSTTSWNILKNSTSNNQSNGKKQNEEKQIKSSTAPPPASLQTLWRGCDRYELTQIEQWATKGQQYSRRILTCVAISIAANATAAGPNTAL
jgi:hypothetical protein